MTRLPDTTFDQRIADWLEDDPISAPPEVLGTVVAAFPSIEQRRAWRSPWRFPTMNRYVLPAAAALMVVVGGVLLLPSLAPPTGDQSPKPSIVIVTPPPTDAATLVPATDPPRVSGFVPAGSLNDPRTEHFAVLLPDGSVLIGAGVGPTKPDSFPRQNRWNTTERWLVDRNTFVYSAELGTSDEVTYVDVARVNQQAFVLPDDRVFVVPSGCWCSPPPRLHAELWSESHGIAKVEVMAAFETRRNGHSATLLADGRILIAGGSTEVADTGTVDTAEIWDPVAGTTTRTGSMRSDRMGHAATLLADGRVLIVGGLSSDPGPGSRHEVRQAEIWDPATGEFDVVPSLEATGVARNISNYSSDSELRLVTLADGRVLVLDRGSARTWSPTTGDVEDAGSMSQPRIGYAVALLPTGQVLVVGGRSRGQAIATAELWDPTTGTFTDAGTMATPRAGPTATVLLDGRVLVVGGFGQDAAALPGDAELWEPGDAP